MITLSFLLPLLGVGTWAVIQYKPWASPGTSVPAVNSDANKDKTKPAVVAPESRGAPLSSPPMSEKKQAKAGPPRPKIREEAGFVPNADGSLKSSPREIRQETQEASPAIRTQKSPSQSPGEPDLKLDALVSV